MQPAWVLLAAAGVLVPTGTVHAQLRVVTYNVAAAQPGETGPRTGMEGVLTAIGDSARAGFTRPIDILLLQEGASTSSTAREFAELLNGIHNSDTYTFSSLDGATLGGGRPMVVYNSAAVALVQTQAIGTVSGTGQPRQTLRYRFRPAGYDSAADFFVYNSHFKAGNDPDSAVRRDLEARTIRVDAARLGGSTPIIYAGDFNLYGSSEAAFQTFVTAGNGQAFDPVAQVGPWSGNPGFRGVHTQSPATTAWFDGQVTGGMDDRFDFQLVTAPVLDGRGFAIIPDSYWAFGNTDTHRFNAAITTGSSTALAGVLPGYSSGQAGVVLQLLSRTSDHLPVVADYQLPARMAASVAPVPERVIVGATVQSALTVSNSAPVAVAAGADRLDYAFAAQGGLVGSGTGSAVPLAAGITHLLEVDTSMAGPAVGEVTVQASSPQASAARFSTTVGTSVLHPAAPSFSAGTMQGTLDLDFGTIALGGPAVSRSFDLFNLAGSLGGTWTAALDLDAVVTAAAGTVFTTTLTPFSGLAAGSGRSFQVSFDPTSLGSHVGGYTLAVSDEKIPGASGQILSVTMRGTVVTAGPVDRVFDVPAGEVVVADPAPSGDGRLLKRGEGTLVLGGPSGMAGGTVVEAGTLLATAAASLGGPLLEVADDARLALDAVALDVARLQLGETAAIDLGTGRLSIDAGGITADRLRAALLDGRAGGTWDGPFGIGSSSAPSLDGAGGFAVGSVINADGSAVVAWASLGDADLDGAVTTADVNAMLTGGLLNTGIAGALWQQGDFDYDGVVTTADVNLLLTTGRLNTGPYVTSPTAMQSVPEPSAVGLGLAGMAAALIARGARSRRGGRPMLERRSPGSRPADRAAHRTSSS
jgi:autotransporter-associated beta strand protein